MAYSPAGGVVNSNIPSSQAVYYDRVSIKNLKANLPFYRGVTRRAVPKMSGISYQNFAWNLYPGNTNPGTEGTVGSSLIPTGYKQTGSLAQYFDFISLSDAIVLTSISPIVEEQSEELGYRAGETVNTLIQSEFDAATSADSSSTTFLANGTFATANTLRAAEAHLLSINARHLMDGKFYGFFHPLVAGDIMTDAANNGMTDIMKHTVEGQDFLKEGFEDVDEGADVLEFAGVRIFSTTTCPTGLTVNSNTGYISNYVVGKDALISYGLGDMEVPNGEKNFKLRVNANLPISAADPAGVVGAVLAYNFFFSVTNRPQPVTGVNTFRRVQTQTSLS